MRWKNRVADQVQSGPLLEPDRRAQPGGPCRQPALKLARATGEQAKAVVDLAQPGRKSGASEPLRASQRLRGRPDLGELSLVRQELAHVVNQRQAFRAPKTLV